MKKLTFIFLMFFMSLASFAQDSVKEIFDKGIQAFNQKDYRLAIKCMDMVVKPSTDFHIRNQAQDVKNRCQELLDRDSISVSKTGLTFKSDGDFKELNIWATGKWEIVRLPDWVSVVKSSEHYVKLWCGVNSGSLERSGNMSIKCGSAVENISLFQDKCAERKGRVLFRTVPNNAYVEILDGWSGFSSTPAILSKGEYFVKISKEGYESCDTTIIIDDVRDEARIIDVALKPLFGKIHPIISSENGLPVKGLDFIIGMHHVDLSDIANSHSFDDREKVEYYGLYSDGCIPVNTGTYEVIVTADGFATEYITVQVPSGEVVELDIKLNSIMGQLLVRDKGRADGAKVVIREIGFSGQVGDTLNVPVGKHHVEIVKDNYMLDEGSLDVSVDKGKLTVADASMTRMVDLLVSTEAGGETLYIDGEKIHSRKKINCIPLIEGEKYNIEVRKEGFWHFVKDISVTAKDTLFDYRNLILEEVHPLKLRTDEGGLLIRLRRAGDKGGEDYGQGMLTDYTRAPEVLNVPYGKYRIELIGKKEGTLKKNEKNLRTYRGTVRFAPNNDRKFIQTWGTSGNAALKILNFEYTLYPSSIEMPSDYMPIPLRANFMDFALCRGLSSSFAEGAMVYTKNMAMPEDYRDYIDPIMPAISIPLTNYDFRIGGGLFPYAEIGLLLSYTYYVEFDKIATKVVDILRQKGKKCNTYTGAFDHFEGHDAFAGLEFSSRLRYFNFYIRAGVQYLKGNRSYSYLPHDPVTSLVNGDYKLVHMPVDQKSLIMTVGFNFGGKHSKGQNMLMIF